ncbi:hypothetical protein ACQ86N_10875 [Puia sp. P3]
MSTGIVLIIDDEEKLRTLLARIIRTGRIYGAGSRDGKGRGEAAG